MGGGGGSAYQISPKPCQVKGLHGRCMFVWECIKSEGTPLGMCMERFMFGSCCAHHIDIDNNLLPGASALPTVVGSQLLDTLASPRPIPAAQLPTLHLPNHIETNVLPSNLISGNYYGITVKSA